MYNLGYGLYQIFPFGNEYPRWMLLWGFSAAKGGLERDLCLVQHTNLGVFGDAKLDSENSLEYVFCVCLCVKWEVSNDTVSESQAV